LIKELENQIELKTRKEEEQTIQTNQLKSDIDTLIKKSKSQSDTLDSLREQLKNTEADLENQQQFAQKWTEEKDDIIEHKKELEKELYDYMNRYSQLKIHKENIELQFQNQLSTAEEKLKSNKISLDTKDDQINKLKEQINEFNEEYQSRIENELNQSRNTQEEYETQLHSITRAHDDEISEFKADINRLQTELSELKINHSVDSSNGFSQKIIDAKNEEIDDLQFQINQLRSHENDQIANLHDIINDLMRRRARK
jgi:chromosome segregation ATPase